ncbi:MAG: hypothetical protein U0892_18515 [Pirellulales bacterium]
MDHTQGFFAHILTNQFLTTVDPNKGRFRSFLLVSFKNYMANQRRSEDTAKRGGRHSVFSLSTSDLEDFRSLEPADTETPEAIYERAWALALLRRVRARLAQECVQSDKEQLFQLLEPHLVESPQALSHAEIGHQLGLSTAAVTMTLYRLRRRYGEILREEVADTVRDTNEVDSELRELIQILGSTRK